MSAAGSQPVRRPNRLLLAAEAPRALGELALLQAARPLLARAPRGDGHPVLVLPGLAADDRSTVPLRRFLRGLGYRTHGWRLGTNVPSPDMIDRLRERLADLRSHDPRPMSIVGWSLGGIYARGIAMASPDAVRTVVTLGSPFRAVPGQESHATPLARLWGAGPTRVSRPRERPAVAGAVDLGVQPQRRHRPVAGVPGRKQGAARDDRGGRQPLRAGPPSGGAVRGGRPPGAAAGRLAADADPGRVAPPPAPPCRGPRSRAGLTHPRHQRAGPCGMTWTLMGATAA